MPWTQKWEFKIYEMIVVACLLPSQCTETTRYSLMYLEKLELFTGQFYPVIPNKGHKFRKSLSKRFEFSTLGATKCPFWEETGRFGQIWDSKGQKGTIIPE